MKHARSAWKKEHASWRLIIQLNLLHSVIRILDAVQSEIDNKRPELDEDEIEEVDHPKLDPILFSEKHHLLKFSLAPLREVT